MTDIQQWRRMIQPARVRIPAVESEDTDSVLSPTTPRKGLKPKLSSYFTQHSNLSVPSKTDLAFDEDLFGPNFPKWPTDEPAPSPEADHLIEAIMCRLLADPYRSLDTRFNGMLMQVFESYRNINDEKLLLLSEIQQEAGRLQATEHALRRAKEEWDQERRDYKAEVKRLELLLAKGSKHGLAEVTLARQDSVLRRGKQRNPSGDETLETIFEFLEKTKRYEDRAWSSQRGSVERIERKSTVLMHGSYDADKVTLSADEKTLQNIDHQELNDEHPRRFAFHWAASYARLVSKRAKQHSTARAQTANSVGAKDEYF